MNLKEAIFAAESVAHLRGYEREILPLTDMVREMYGIMFELNRYQLSSGFLSETDYVEAAVTKLSEFMISNPID